MSVCVTYSNNTYGDVPMVLMRTRYSMNNNCAIMGLSRVEDEDGQLTEEVETFAYLTVNLGESLDAHEFFLDADIEDIKSDLEAADIARDTGIVGYSGFESYHLMRLSDEAFDAMDVVDYEADEPCAKGIEALSRYLDDPEAYRLGPFSSSMPMPSASRSLIADGFDGQDDYDFDIPF